MTSRSASSPTDGILRSKRVRIDEHPTSAPASTASSPRKQTPTAAAKARIESTVATLPKELNPTVIKLANEIFMSYTRFFNKQKKHDEVKNDDDYIPKSIGESISLGMFEELKKGEDYKALSDRADAAVLAARKSLKPFFMEAQELNIAHLRQKTIESVATALPRIAELLLADVDKEQCGKHQLVNDFLQTHCDKVMSYLGITGAEFSNVYIRVNEITELPQSNTSAAQPPPPLPQAGNHASTVIPITHRHNPDGPHFEVEEEEIRANMDLELHLQENSNAGNNAAFTINQPSQEETLASPKQMAALPAPPSTQRLTPLINGHATCLGHLRTFVAALANAQETYHATIKSNERKARLEKVMGRQEKKTSTDETAQKLAQEGTMDALTLGAMTDQKIEKARKPVRQDVSSIKGENKRLNEKLNKLEKEMKKLLAATDLKSQSSKDSRGAKTTGAASTKKSADQSTSPSSTKTLSRRAQRAVAKGGDTQTASSNPSQCPSRSKSPKKRRNSKKQRSKSRGASNRN